MTTAVQVINQALGILGVRGAGEAVDGTDLDDPFYRLNSLVDLWRTESLYAYASLAVSTTLRGSVQTLTIGPTGDIVTPYRPTAILDGSFFTSGSIDYPLDVLSDASFSKIGMKTFGTLGPSAVFYDPTLPNGTLHFYPQASGDVPLTLQVQQQMLQFADLTTNYTLPPGYANALAFTLAEEMSADYGRQLSATASRRGMLARRAIKRANHVTPTLEMPYMAGPGCIMNPPDADVYTGGNAGSA